MRPTPSRTLMLSMILPLLLASHARGATFGRADNYILPGAQTLHDDLYAAGKTVDIQGTVDGDLVVGGQTVLISGVVTGDVIAAARELTISGRIGGTLRAAGNNVTMNGPVGHDVVVGCGTFVVGPSGQVGRDALVGAGSASFGGRVDRDVRVGAGSATFSAPVGGVVYARSKTIALLDGAVLEKDLLYTSRNDATRAQGAIVRGRVERRTPPAEPSARRAGGAAVGWVRGLIGFLLFGALLQLLIAGSGATGSRTLASSPLASLGLGALVAFAVPCAAAFLFVVGVMVGGWWIALGAIVLYFLALAAGYVVASVAVGSLLLARSGNAAPAYGWSLALGLFLVGLITAIPVLGKIVGWTAAVFGVGALALVWYRAWRASRPAASPAAPLAT
jgi:hypothetical protein